MLFTLESNSCLVQYSILLSYLRALPMCQTWMENRIQDTLFSYTLSHLENDHDVSAYSRGRRCCLCFLARSQRNPMIDVQRMCFAAFIHWAHADVTAILCLTLRTTMMSARIPDEDACCTGNLCVCPHDPRIDAQRMQHLSIGRTMTSQSF